MGTSLDVPTSKDGGPASCVHWPRSSKLVIFTTQITPKSKVHFFYVLTCSGFRGFVPQNYTGTQLIAREGRRGGPNFTPILEISHFMDSGSYATAAVAQQGLCGLETESRFRGFKGGNKTGWKVEAASYKRKRSAAHCFLLTGSKIVFL